MTAEIEIETDKIPTATRTFSSVISFHCSAKYLDTESGLYYYGFRYYQPSTGRWLSRDPIEEDGGDNLYAGFANGPLEHHDSLGLREAKPCCCVEDITAVTSGDFQGGKSIFDYFPGLVGEAFMPPQGKLAGPYQTTTGYIGVNVQIVTQVKGPGVGCSFSQHVFVEDEYFNGVPSGRGGHNYDDINGQGWDQSQPPFRQYINGNPSMADPPYNQIIRNSYSKRWLTTCLNSGGPSVGKQCKYSQCCVKWVVEMKVNKKLKVVINKVWIDSKWCTKVK